MKYILFILLMLLFSSAVPSKVLPTGCLQMDLMILGDYSSSIAGSEEFVVDAMKAFVDKFDLSETGLKIGVYVFNDNTYVISPLTNDKEDLLKKLDVLSKLKSTGGTAMTRALSLTTNELFSANARPTYRKLIIIITDGDPNNEMETYLEAQHIKKLGIGICGVMIQDSSSAPKFLKSICMDSCYVETNYNTLVEELRKLDVCF